LFFYEHLPLTKHPNTCKATIIGKKLTRRGSNKAYNTIPRSKEWLMVNCVVNVTRNYLLGFYIFKSEWIRDNYIKMCKCRNPSLGLVTKVRACKATGQKGSPGVTPHAPGSVGECD
jgi:hypothetical protein